MIGLLQENGPCIINDDSNSTTLNPWSWNNEVNMLYIDQPNQVGFSYDIPTNGTTDEFEVTIQDFSEGVPEQNNTFYVGTFPSQNPNNTANGTTNAARSLWHFAQTWFQEFPAYKPNNSAISIFTESYGGRYGPAFAAFFEEQNERIANESISDEGEEFIIHLDTLGIINGCIDLLIQEPSYPEFAYNNTYGIEAINQTLYQQALDNFNRPETGCRALILECQALANEGDPNATGNNATVNQACSAANVYCGNEVEAQYINESGRNYYDIAAIDPTPFPPNYYLGFLAQNYVQAALGVPINYTQSTNGVYEAFNSIGDYARTDIRGGQIQDLAYLLDNGVKVSLQYGDRDYACNCTFLPRLMILDLNDDQANNEMQGLVPKPSLSKSHIPAALPSTLPATPPSLPTARIMVVSSDNTVISPLPACSRRVTRFPHTNLKHPTVSSTVRSLARISARGKLIPIRIAVTAVRGRVIVLESGKNRQ